MSEYRKSFTYRGQRYYVRANTQEELYTKIAVKKIEIDKGIASGMSVEEWALKCVATYKIGQKEITKAKYLQRLRHCILEEIGCIPISKVYPIQLQEVMNMQIGKSRTQVNDVYQMLKFIFGKALDNGLIQSDPSRGLVKPKGYKNIRRALTEEELDAFLKVVKKDKRFLMYKVMLDCGLRPSEAQNLEKSDLVLVQGTPCIRVRGTKTENSKRTVPIPKDLYETLKSFPSEILFLTSHNNKYYGKSYERLNKTLYRAMDIELGAKVYRNKIVESKLAKDFCPYCFRHTFITNMARNGVDIRVLSRISGNSLQINNNTYTHLTETDLINALER